MDLLLLRCGGSGLVPQLPRLSSLHKSNLPQREGAGPNSPVDSRDPDARYYHIFEDGMDVGQKKEWVQQAAAVPGWDGY